MIEGSHQSPDFLQEIIDAHGGLERHKKISYIEVDFRASGAVLAVKGYHDGINPTASIDIKTPRTAFQRLLPSDPYSRWIYTPTSVSIENYDGRTVEAREDPRDSFTAELTTPWDSLHLTYFFGYALWTYVLTPFIFARPGFTTKELGRHDEEGQEWRVLEVTYPPEIPFHSTVSK
ncbi:hypothetical protein F5884DRAFT_853145 [Xylogone sp. PMI_703]|nr:hypothetical protein F5884DRAFT_853145 [Xylogone sp. PMI_703]